MATDQEEGPADPKLADDRVFIISKKGEHYLHVTPAGTSEADVARQLIVAQDSVRTAVDTTRRTVEQACAHAEEAATQLQIAASVEQAKDSVKQAASESAASAASSAVPAANAEVKSEVSGSRQAEGESTSLDEKPFLHAFLVDDSKDEEPEPPEMMTIYEDVLERPIEMDEDNATLLATETWSTAEKELPTATDADLKAAQRAAGAAA